MYRCVRKDAIQVLLVPAFPPTLPERIFRTKQRSIGDTPTAGLSGEVIGVDETNVIFGTICYMTIATME